MIAIPAGVIAAVRANSLLDRLLMVVSISGVAIPSFFFGILLILLFAVVLGWLPSGGYVDIGDDPIEHFKYMILPTLTPGLLGGRADWLAWYGRRCSMCSTKTMCEPPIPKVW